MTDKLKVLSLFCGCGGLDFGFHQKNDLFTVVKSYDSLVNAVNVYNRNYGDVAIEMDVKNLLDENFNLGFTPDVIVGGPPCQDFSVAGKKVLGERASLTETFIDVVYMHRPKYMIMENVPTIKTIGKEIFLRIEQRLQDAGYGLTTQVVYMPDYGVPQERKRLFVIGKLGGQDGSFRESIEALKMPVKSIEEYSHKYKVDLGLDGKTHIYRHPRNYSRRGVYSINELYPTVRGCLRKIPPTYKFHEKDTIKNPSAIFSPDYQFVANIQTFPSGFDLNDKKAALLIGNAVPPLFSDVLAQVIAKDHYGS